MSQEVSVRELFLGRQDEMRARLRATRASIPHPGSKGDETELCWLDMFGDFLPKRYKAKKGFVVDSTGSISNQIDIIIHDAHYSPLLFRRQSTCYVAAESVYAVFEVKQELTKEHLEYAGRKAESVRALKRTSVAIPHAGGTHDAKVPFEIIAGVLTTASVWAEPLGAALEETLRTLPAGQSLQLGCALEHGSFTALHDDAGALHVQRYEPDTALISFFLEFLRVLQSVGTVPAIDFAAYRQAVE